MYTNSVSIFKSFFFFYKKVNISFIGLVLVAQSEVSQTCKCDFFGLQ